MTKRAFALLLGLVISAPVAAQNEPSEVTDQEIAKYKALASTSCQDAGRKQGDPKEKVDAFCECLIMTISKTMTRVDWQRAYFYSLKGQTEEERQLLEPHLKNGTVCRIPPSAAAEKPKDAQSAPRPKALEGLRPPSK